MSKKIGVGICGSFCSMDEMLKGLSLLKKEGYDLYCFMSNHVYFEDSRFYTCQELKEKVKQFTKHPIYHTIAQGELFGPKIQLDAFIVLPCTSNTLAKLAHGICDNGLTMAIKATLRNQKPIVIAFYTNDALGSSGVNIMNLFNKKHIYFVPFYQDDYVKKPNSMVSDVSKLIDTLDGALKGIQLQPVVLVKND